MKKDNKGFSLVELLVVIAIMVVLVGVIAPSLLGNIEKSRESNDIQILDNIAAVVQGGLANEEFYSNVEAGKYANVKISDAFAASPSAKMNIFPQTIPPASLTSFSTAAKD